MKQFVWLTLSLCISSRWCFVASFVPCLQGRAESSLYSASKLDKEQEIAFESLKGKRVLVVGGSGRVGGSVVTQLIKRGSDVTVGGTNIAAFEKSKTRWQKVLGIPIERINFVALNREDKGTVLTALRAESFDLVVHTAGPFQGKVSTKNGVLDACVSSKIPYVDVCDDYCTARAAKAKYSKKAQEEGVPCIISTGCWVRICLIELEAVSLKASQSYPRSFSLECPA